MNLNDSIDQLVLKLDKSEDMLLIDLLKSKKAYIKDEFCKRHSITEKEKLDTIKGMKQMLKNITKTDFVNPKWYNKIENILNNNDCDNCKYSVERILVFEDEKSKYMGCDENSIVCKNCLNRCGLLENVKYEYEKEREIFIEGKVLTNELIEMKTIINKLKRKVKNYETS